jgi:hypothetical protein
MLVELEKGRIDLEELGVLKKIIIEKAVQETILQDQLKTTNNSLKICNDTISSYQTLRDNDKIACDEAISKAKPGFWNTVLYTFGVLGAGLIIGLLL